MNCGNKPSLNITDAITIEAWVKPAVSQGGSTRIAEKLFSTSWYVGIETPDIVNVYINGAERARTSSNILSIGEWNHIAFIYDKDAGGTDELKIYVNAEVKATGNYSTAIGIDAENITISRGTATFNGTIDEVRIYDAALEASLIKARYVEGLDKLHAEGKIDGKEYYQRLTETGF